MRSCLSGEAEKIIQSIETTENNYHIAWELLETRYNNKKIIIQNHLQLLFELPSLTRESANDLRALVDNSKRHIRALESLKLPTDQWDTLIIYLVSTKLDKVTKREWERSNENTELPELKELWNFLEKRSQLLASENINTWQSQAPRSGAIVSTKAKHVHLEVNRVIQCSACNHDHNIQSCETFKKATYDEKVNIVRKNGLCFNCSRSGHMVSSCRAGRCPKCQRRHHVILHPAHSNSGGNISSNARVVSSCLGEPHIWLATVLIDVIDASGKHHLCRAMLDQGSQANFITEDYCRKLNLNKTFVNTPIIGISVSHSNVRIAAKIDIN